MTEKEQKPKTLFELVSSFMTDESSKETSHWIAFIEAVLGKENASITEFSDTFKNLPVGSLGGFWAEVFQTATFNVDASVKQTGESVLRLASNEKASPDMAGSWGGLFSSKFNKDAPSTLYEQSKAHVGDTQGLSRYHGMGRIVPADQLDSAKTIADQKFEHYSQTHPALAGRFHETGENLTDRIVSPEGAESKPLTKDEADQQASEIKAGHHPKLNFDDSVSLDDCLSEIGQAAGGAALVNASIHMAPVVIGSLRRLFNDPAYGTKEFYEELQKWSGEKVMASSFDSFIKAFVASSLTVANKAGALTGPLKDCHPSVYAGIAIVSVESAKKMWLYAHGQCSGDEAADQVLKSGLKTTATLTGKTVGQVLIPIPIVGGIIGAFLASYAADRGIDSVENSTAIRLMRELDKQYVLHKDILGNMFETVVDYNDVAQSYEKTILASKATATQQAANIALNDGMISEEREVIKEGDMAIEKLEENRTLIENFFKRMEA